VGFDGVLQCGQQGRPRLELQAIHGAHDPRLGIADGKAGPFSAEIDPQ